MKSLNKKLLNICKRTNIYSSFDWSIWKDLLQLRLRVCVFASIHLEGFICLEQLYQETNQRCCVEDLQRLFAKRLHGYFRMKHCNFLTSH